MQGVAPLYRILQTQGFGSRRECRALITGGRVRVDCVAVSDPERTFPAEGLALDVAGTPWRSRSRVYLALNKPAGYECSRAPRDHPSVYALLPTHLARRGVQCVGRLDQDTTGLLLFSDDGAFLHRLTSPRRHVDKTYDVLCRHEVSDTMLAALRAGVMLRDDPAPVAARACVRLGSHALRLTLDAGRYHQVKRMLAAVGNRVDALSRCAIGAYHLPDELAPGQWCLLADNALAALVQPAATILNATASATSMPSTAADRMPPA